MNLSYWCVLLAGVMPAATVGIAKWGRRDYNNAEPRRWLEKQDGRRHRADAAHRNHFEAFPFFAVGILIAQQCNAPQNTINILAILFIVSRMVYTYFYLTNRSTLRSISWFIAYLSVIALFFIAAFHGG
jgi:uncharacterized MAPEG superfamily protein